MTTTVNGHKPLLTDGDDVRMCVRAPETGAEAPKMGAERDGSAYTGVLHTRVLPNDPPKVKRRDKIRDAASLHAAEAGRALAGNTTVNELPLTVADVWRQVFPARGETSSKLVWLAGTWAGLFRAIVLTGCWGVAVAVGGTRLRAGAALCLTAAVAGVLAVYGALH